VNLSIALSLAVALAVFVAMASDRVAAHRAALAGAAVLLLTGSLDGQGLAAVFGSPGLVTITGLMLVAAALVHTGLIDRLVRRLRLQAGRRPRRAWLQLYAAVMLGSALFANTPMVVLAVPAVLALARQSEVAAQRVLLPVVFLASLGGCLSLVGSSVNLIASESLLRAGLPGLSLFEFSPLGLVCAAAGALFLAIAGPRLLPAGRQPSPQLYEPERALVGEVAFGTGDHELGVGVTEWLARHPGVSVLDCRRNESESGSIPQSPRSSLLADLRIRAGDRLVVEAPAQWWLQRARLASAPADVIEGVFGVRGSGAALKIEESERGAGNASERSSIGVEVWLPPQSRWLGLRLEALRLDRIFGVQLLGISGALGRVHSPHRHRLQIGDRLLLLGPRKELERLLASEAALGPLQVERASHASGRQWVAWLALGVVGLSALGLIELKQAAVLAALVVVLGGALAPSEPLNRPSMRTLGLVFGMLAIGESLVRSGAADLLGAVLAGTAMAVPPWLLLGLVLLVATAATEILTNSAAVALLAPVVISLCLGLGLAPAPFVVAVLFGASASFASPMAYQTNSYVQQIGGYHFRDFVRLGLPLKLLVCALCWALIPLMWPLRAVA
jgi:di/tricarboxylate transporter